MLTKTTNRHLDSFSFQFNKKELTTKHLIVESIKEPRSVIFSIDGNAISVGCLQPLENLPQKYYQQVNQEVNQEEKTQPQQLFYFVLWDSSESLPLFLIDFYRDINITIINDTPVTIKHWFCEDNISVAMQEMIEHDMKFKQRDYMSETTLTFNHGRCILENGYWPLNLQGLI
jgi:hypothetical protein